MRARLLNLALLVTLIAALASAHHGNAGFDTNTPLTLHGKVTRVEWINPHAWIHLAVEQADGTIANWLIECGPPNILLRRGLSKDVLAEGSELTIDRYAFKEANLRAQGIGITLQNGKRILVNGSFSASGKSILFKTDR